MSVIAISTLKYYLSTYSTCLFLTTLCSLMVILPCPCCSVCHAGVLLSEIRDGGSRSGSLHVDNDKQQRDDIRSTDVPFEERVFETSFLS